MFWGSGLIALQNVPHFFPVLSSSCDDPFPISVVEIFTARLGNARGLQVGLVDIRAQGGGAIAATIDFQSFFGQDPVGEHLRSPRIRRLVTDREHPWRAIDDAG